MDTTTHRNDQQSGHAATLTIEKLPAHQQNTLLKTIDGFLKGVAS